MVNREHVEDGIGKGVLASGGHHGVTRGVEISRLLIANQRVHCEGKSHSPRKHGHCHIVNLKRVNK